VREFTENLRLREENRRAAERTRLISGEPGVDALGVKCVAADREEPEHIFRLEFRQADGAIGGGVGGAAGERVEGEKRECFDERILLRGRDLPGVRPVVMVVDGGRGGGMVAVALAPEEAEEEVE